MVKYKNLNGNSGVLEYEIKKEAIIVKFRDNPCTYFYTYEMPGETQVEEMKLLAISGLGLSTFISTHIGKRYAKKSF